MTVKRDSRGRRTDRVHRQEERKMRGLQRQGLSIQEIASELKRKPETVKRHLEAQIQPEETLPSLAVQQAASEHQKDLRKVAESLRYNLTVPSPKEAQVDLLATASEMAKGATGETLQKDLARLVDICRPGPKWQFGPDNFRAFGFAIEGHSLFTGLLEHLESTNLAAKFRDYRTLLRRYIWLCHTFEGKVDELRLEETPPVKALYEQLSRLKGELTQGLDLYIQKRIFPGKCRFCPDL